MKKGLLAIIALLLGTISFFCFLDYRSSLNPGALVTYGAIGEDYHEESDELLDKDVSSIEMERVYRELGNGINLGNDLDACDWNYFGSDKSVGFQAAIVYNTAPWTAWDASDYMYFDSNGCLTINWDLSKLNSRADALADNFALQLVNHYDDYEETTVKCTINSATLVYPNGISEELYSTGDSFVLTVKNNVTDYFYFDLEHLGVNTSNIEGGSVSISLKISDYYLDLSDKITKLETSWGNPPVTKEIIQTIKDAGFNTVRVPVSYFNHISPDGTIDKEFLDRVDQVVDWILDCGMYCIIDVHHDTGNDGWIKASENSYNKNKDIVGYIFSQIAERFKYKSNHLILEGLNETVDDSNRWNNVPAANIQVMNKWNQLFVDSVRFTGGNNSDRYLLINTYAALPLEECLSGFTMPSDSVNDRIFIGIHCYFNTDNMQKNYDIIKKYAYSYHFVIGEWAIWNNAENRVAVTQQFVSMATELGIPTIWWDNGRQEETAILDRNTLNWYDKVLLKEVTGK